MAEDNKKANQRTFVLFFYAGHGAMIDNQQVLILNGVEKETKHWKTKEVSRGWDYIYKIERKFSSNFTNLGEFSYVLAIFNCCRSQHKETEALLKDQIGAFDEQEE